MSSQKLRVCELFAGIGGFRLGIEQALGKENTDFVFISEWDKYAAQIYNKNFEETPGQRDTRPRTDSALSDGESRTLRGSKPTFGIDTRDIRTVSTSEIPDHELLVGGFPCQAFSIAGKRKGFDDTRGTLFFEIARILRDKRPKYFILENVKGLLSHDGGKTFATILGVLTDLGYDFQWQVLNSKNFGVPQNRERVFIVGHIRGQPRPQVFPITTECKETACKERQVGWEAWDDYNKKLSDITPTLTEPHHNSIRLIQINNPNHSNDRVYKEEGLAPALNTMQGGRRQPKIAHTLRNGGRASGIDKKQNWDSYEFNGKIRRLTPTECERLQGFPDGWTEGVSDTQRYKCLGNAVTVNVVFEIAKRLTNVSVRQTKS